MSGDTGANEISVHARARSAAGFHRRSLRGDLAAMRDALAAMGADPSKANPLMPADLS